MKLCELEKRLSKTCGVKFLEKFHEIHETGAMEWMECGTDELKINRESYMNTPETFMFSLSCDCEPLRFEEIPERIKELNVWLAWRRDDKEEVLKGKSCMIPFAQTAGGDLYCFFYEDRYSEPMIIQYCHDCYDTPTLWGENSAEFLYAMMLSSVDWEEDITGKVWKAHLKYLSPEHREKIADKSTDELLDDFEKLSVSLDARASNISIFEKLY